MLVTRVLLRTKLTSDQVGRSVKLEYYLLEEEQGEWEQYGIEVVMYRGRSEERRAVRHITPMMQRAVELAERLAEGKVTPATLPEILEDIL
jgi:hypothetical protein